MTSTLCQSAMFDRFIALWVAKIVEFLIAIVETILTIAMNVRTSLHEPGAICRQGRTAAPGAELGALSPDDGEDRNTVRHDQAAVPTVFLHTVSQMRAARQYRDGAGVDQGNPQTRSWQQKCLHVK
jgi:hypothetical protein